MVPPLSIKLVRDLCNDSESSGRIFSYHAGNGSAVGQCPFSRRLQEWGEVISLVFGGFAKVLEGVKHIMDTLARQWLKKEGLARGTHSSSNRSGEVFYDSIVW